MAPRNCAPSCIASAPAAPRDAAEFPASYAADAYRDGGRQRCTGDVVPRLRHRCDPHPRPVDAPPRPRPGNRPDPVLTADHDGVIVADVVAEWARRHGQPYQLKLTGPAGGSWTSGTGGEES